MLLFKVKSGLMKPKSKVPSGSKDGGYSGKTSENWNKVRYIEKNMVQNNKT